MTNNDKQQQNTDVPVHRREKKKLKRFTLYCDNSLSLCGYCAWLWFIPDVSSTKSSYISSTEHLNVTSLMRIGQYSFELRQSSRILSRERLPLSSKDREFAWPSWWNAGSVWKGMFGSSLPRILRTNSSPSRRFPLAGGRNLCSLWK